MGRRHDRARIGDQLRRVRRQRLEDDPGIDQATSEIFDDVVGGTLGIGAGEFGRPDVQRDQLGDRLKLIQRQPTTLVACDCDYVARW